MNQRVKYWLELSEYDLITAETMLTAGRFLYVGFMCHQAIEKIIKANFCNLNQETPPFSHNLTYLAKKAKVYEKLPDSFKDIIDSLEPLNIEARYPSDKEALFKELTFEKCKIILNNTKELQLWFKSQL
jgi:HEPN domain-containing protein